MQIVAATQESGFWPNLAVNDGRIVHTPDGGLLTVEDRGDPAGGPVLVHHRAPNSRHSAFYGPYVRDAAERGLRLIGYDRSGYGESPPSQAVRRRLRRRCPCDLR